MLLLSLVHFCELNGPSVVFVSQQRGGDVPVAAVARAGSSGGCNGCNPWFPASDTLAGAMRGLLAAFVGSATLLPDDVLGVETAVSVVGSTDVHAIVATIRARSSADGQAGDGERDVHTQRLHTFVGSKYPVDSNLYPILRTACVRSLSCELTQTRTGGAVFFSFNPATIPSLQNVYCLSYMFQLVDPTSRGNVRAYAFILISDNRNTILLNWEFLVSQFATLSTMLQTLAENATSANMAKKELLQQGTRSVGKDSSHIKDVNPPQIGTLSPEQFLRRRGNPLPSVRSLVDIVGVKSVFVGLHMRFTGILCMISTENCLLEQPVPNVDCAPLSIPEIQPHITTVITDADNLNTRALSVSSLYRSLSQTDMVHFFNHLFMGDQTILRGTESATIAFSYLIRLILPESCISVLTPLLSDVYHESWECNLLLLRPETTIPVHHLCASNTGFCLLDITNHSVVLSNHNYTFITAMPNSSLSSLNEEEEWYATRMSIEMTRALACCFRAGVDDTQLEVLARALFERIVSKWVGLGYQFVTFTKSSHFNPDMAPVAMLLHTLVTGDYATAAAVTIPSSQNSQYSQYSSSAMSLLLNSPLISPSLGNLNAWIPSSSPNSSSSTPVRSSTVYSPSNHMKRQPLRLSLTAISQGVNSSLRRVSSVLSASLSSSINSQNTPEKNNSSRGNIMDASYFSNNYGETVASAAAGDAFNASSSVKRNGVSAGEDVFGIFRFQVEWDMLVLKFLSKAATRRR